MTLSGTLTRVFQPSPESAVEYLQRDRAWAAYPLAYLEPGLGPELQLWASEGGNRIQSLLIVVQLPRLVSVFASGDPAALSRLLMEIPALPPSGVFSARPDTLRALEGELRITTSYQMTRMRVTAGSLRDAGAAPVRRLGVGDLDVVKGLYGMWTDVNQLPGQLERGVYCGVTDGERLVAVAGTHCVSPTHRIGAIGNVLTHVDHRRRGYASATTAAVARALFEIGIEDVVLNVRRGNEGARGVYANLGFTEHCDFVEGVFHSRARSR
ncbi:MAG: GNAT family N-acetyltransferase [Candidatus Dormibacteria bacterium]